MEKKTVVITGAGSGLGFELAKHYSSQGLHVCLLGRTKQKLEQTAKECKGSTSIYAVDVSMKSEVDQAFDAIKKEHHTVDILVNNAGLGAFDLAEKIEEESVHQMIDVNTKGTIFCTQAVLPEMKKRNSGYIINIISTAGKQGKVNESVYCASKFAVRGFTESLVLELKETPIHVIGVYMGGMKTEFWEGILTDEQTKHLMEPSDVAEIILENTKIRNRLTVEEVLIRNK